MISQEKEQLFINPKPKIGYGFYAIRRSLIQAVAHLKKQIHGNVLDLGCGIMPYKEFLQQSGKIENYLGIDLKVSNYHNTVTPDLYWDGITIPVADNTQDWVIVTEFLEHYYDTHHILKEIRRVLKSGGKVFFTVPCIYMIHEAPYDYNRFTPFALEKQFQDAGYKLSTIFPLGGFNYSLVIMMSLWNKNSTVRGIPRLFSKLFLFLFHKYLLDNDSQLKAFNGNEQTTFNNSTMPSGLWGYGEK